MQAAGTNARPSTTVTLGKGYLHGSANEMPSFHRQTIRMCDAHDKDVTIVRSFHRHVTWHYLPSKPITQAKEQDPVQHTAYLLLQIAATLALPVGEMSEVAGFDTGSKYGALLLLRLNIT